MALTLSAAKSSVHPAFRFAATRSARTASTGSTPEIASKIKTITITAAAAQSPRKGVISYSVR